MEYGGLLNYAIFFLTSVGIFGIIALGLNIQWGYTGQLNIGIHGFFAVGAYTAAILTASPSISHLGGFGMPFLVGIVAAMVLTGILALGVGLITLNLRSDYLAIASIGLAEIIRLVLKNEQWLTAGVRGIAGIDKPVGDLRGFEGALAFLGVVAAFVALTYFIVQILFRSPWARVLRAIRSNEDAVRAAGKNVLAFRVQAFVVGSLFMGLGGALYAHFSGFISPSAFEPMYGTFLIWVMLIAGGSGNNRGALLGALVIWGVWSLTPNLIGWLADIWEAMTGISAEGFESRSSALRILLIGLLLNIILITRPQGILPEKPPKRFSRDA